MLTRWEIENYLLEPTAVAKLLESFPVDGIPDEDALLDLMISAALAELHVTAACCTAHPLGLDKPRALTPCADIETLEETVRDWLAAHLPKYEENLIKVRAFDPGDAAEKRKRLAELLRMVDGKRVVERLQRRWVGLNKPVDRLLAGNVGLSRDRSDDLFELMTSLRRRA
ncbi:MAG: hypothetical protein EPN26_10630 [Rhodospirillales bacterium]|nr:MAG: hypothetical protein EPN26_10630 [Rhodospirillales bacterium]